MMNRQNYQFVSETTYTPSFQSYSTESNISGSPGIWGDDPAIAGVYFQQGGCIASYAPAYGVTVLQPTQVHEVTEQVKMTRVVNTSGVYGSGCTNTSYSSFNQSHGIKVMHGHTEPSCRTHDQPKSNSHQSTGFQQMQANSSHAEEYQCYNYQSSVGAWGDFKQDYACRSQGTSYAVGCSRVGGVESGGMGSYYEQVNQYSHNQQYGGACSVSRVDGLESTFTTQSDVPMFADWNNQGTTCYDQPVAQQGPYEEEPQSDQHLGEIQEVDGCVYYVSFPDEDEQKQNEFDCEDEIVIPVYEDSSIDDDESVQDFEYIEDKQEFEEWDLSLHLPGQESILNEENVEVLTNRLNAWLSAVEAQEVPVEQERTGDSAADSESASTTSEEHCLVSLSSDKIPEFASSVCFPDSASKDVIDNVQSKPPSKMTEDATTNQDSSEGYFGKLSGLVGRAIKEVLTCYIKGQLV